MIFITGDCHGEFRKFSTHAFPEQKELTKNDIVIILGDFGCIWDERESSFEKRWLGWLDSKNFTTVFIDGNHENFDRLNSEYEVVDFHGGKVHKIRDSIYHLMRGEVFDFEGKKFFAFGGASSHDISDGIISRSDFNSDSEYKRCIKKWVKERKMFRINHVSWWEDELPSDEQIAHAETTLDGCGFTVDYVLTHCAPDSVVRSLCGSFFESDKLTRYFESLLPRLAFKKWFFGHYHDDIDIDERFSLLYDDIIKLG